MAGEAVYLKPARRLPEPGWPPLEGLKRYQIKHLRQSLLDRLKILAIRMHKPAEHVANLVIEAGLDALEGKLANKPD